MGQIGSRLLLLLLLVRAHAQQLCDAALREKTLRRARTPDRRSLGRQMLQSLLLEKFLPLAFDLVLPRQKSQLHRKDSGNARDTDLASE